MLYRINFRYEASESYNSQPLWNASSRIDIPVQTHHIFLSVVLLDAVQLGLNVQVGEQMKQVGLDVNEGLNFQQRQTQKVRWSCTPTFVRTNGSKGTSS